LTGDIEFSTIFIEAANLEKSCPPVGVADHRKQIGELPAAGLVFDKADDIDRVPAQERRCVIGS
jgi:hypothetical protein